MRDIKVRLRTAGLLGAAVLSAACHRAATPSKDRVTVVGSGTVVDGLITPLKDAIASAAEASLDAQDHGSGKAFTAAVLPELQPTIAVRSTSAHDTDFAAANLAASFRCVMVFAIAYDRIAFWVPQDHPVAFIELDALKQLLFKETDDKALPTWAFAGVPASSGWGNRKIAIMMPRGPKNGGEDSGTRREAERLLSGGDSERFSLEGYWPRSSENIRTIPADVEAQTTDTVAPMGLASSAFVGNAKVKPLAIYDAAHKRNFDFGVRPLWLYALVPKQGQMPGAVVRTIRTLLTPALQRAIEKRQFKPLVQPYSPKKCVCSMRSAAAIARAAG